MPVGRFSPLFMTTEQKLAAVIAAQVKGGFRRFADADCKRICERIKPHSSDDGRDALLFVLLDPEGLRAAYGETKMSDNVIGRPQFEREGWNSAAINILQAWLSGGAEAA